MHDRFSLWMSLDSDGEESEITFGDFRTERITSHIIWAPVSNHPGRSGRSGFWQVTIEDVALGGEAMGLGMHQASVDTGTSMIAGPSALINAITAEINVDPDCAN